MSDQDSGESGKDAAKSDGSYIVKPFLRKFSETLAQISAFIIGGLVLGYIVKEQFAPRTAVVIQSFDLPCITDKGGGTCTASSKCNQVESEFIAVGGTCIATTPEASPRLQNFGLTEDGTFFCSWGDFQSRQAASPAPTATLKIACLDRRYLKPEMSFVSPGGLPKM